MERHIYGNTIERPKKYAYSGVATVIYCDLPRPEVRPVRAPGRVPGHQASTAQGPKQLRSRGATPTSVNAARCKANNCVRNSRFRPSPNEEFRMGKLLRPRLFLLVVLVTVAGAAPALAGDAKGPLDFTGLKRWDLGIYTLVVFGLLLWVVRRYAWPHIETGLARRAENIRTELDAAKAARAEAEELLRAAKAEREEATRQAGACLDEARAVADKLKSDMREQTEQEIAAEWARAEREIATEKEVMVRDVRDHAVELGVEMATTVIRQRVSGEAHERLINEALAGLKGF